MADDFKLEGEDESTSFKGQCRGCGADLLMVRCGKTGNWHPVDMPGEKRWLKRLDNKYVTCTTYQSHFETCPDAEKFRKGRTL
jgi:hypothetical protein